MAPSRHLISDFYLVMAEFVPAIPSFMREAPKLPGTTPGMTELRVGLSRRDRRRHREERAGDVPEQVPVGRQRQRMRGAGQDDELAIAVRQ